MIQNQSFQNLQHVFESRCRLEVSSGMQTRPRYSKYLPLWREPGFVLHWTTSPKYHSATQTAYRWGKVPAKDRNSVESENEGSLMVWIWEDKVVRQSGKISKNNAIYEKLSVSPISLADKDRQSPERPSKNKNSARKRCGSLSWGGASMTSPARAGLTQISLTHQISISASVRNTWMRDSLSILPITFRAPILPGLQYRLLLLLVQAPKVLTIWSPLCLVVICECSRFLSL
jgi:hypothetical protein